jgi:L-rhamnose mutarotase
MSVDPSQQAEYARRHQQIWRDLRDTLLAHGVATYSIFLDPATSDLFAYVEYDSEERWAAVAGTEVCQRWWKYMREIMPTADDNTPITAPLTEVFHLTRHDKL